MQVSSGSVAWHLQGDPSDPLSCLCIRQVPDTSFAPVTFDQRSPRNSVIDAGNVVRRSVVVSGRRWRPMMPIRWRLAIPLAVYLPSTYSPSELALVLHFLTCRGRSSSSAPPSLPLLRFGCVTYRSMARCHTSLALGRATPSHV